MTRLLHIIVFLTGLAAIGWIGAGYAGTNPLALSITALIAVCYLAGAIELLCYQQATRSLTRALQGLSTAPAQLSDWLDSLHPSLRNTARLRIEGERISLPGPALTPYLVGLLVLLGMLGTFLGMVATLRGTGMALESATDLAAMRASLAAPVKGLGFAFGTSVAGVAASAMLGLLSALCRRSRLQAGQLLDTQAATTLRAYSLAHQREESFKLLRGQAEVMPALAEQLAAMMAAMQRQNQTLNEQLLAGQQAFHSKTEAVYGRLANSVETALTHSVSASAQAAGAAIQPAVETTMQTLARETTAWRETITQAMQAQMDGLSARLEKTSAALAGNWSHALAEQQQTNQILNQDLRATLEGFSAGFDTRAGALLADVSARLEHSTSALAAGSEHTAQAWSQALQRQQENQEALAAQLSAALAQFAGTFETRSASLLTQITERLTTVTDSVTATQTGVAATWQTALAEQRTAQHALTRELSGMLEQFGQNFDQRAKSLVDGVAARLDGAAGSIANHAQHTLAAWQEALASQQQGQQDLNQGLRSTLEQFAHTFETRSGALIDGIAARLESSAAAVSANTANTLQEWRSALDGQAREQAALAQHLRDALAGFAAAFDTRSASLVDKVAARLDVTTEQLARAWGEALAQHEQASAALTGAHQQALDAAAQRFEDHSASLLATIDQAHGRLHGELAARDEARLSAWTQSLAGVAAALRTEWEDTGNRSLARQQEICDNFSAAISDITTQADMQSQRTIAEIERLLEAASQAPKAAADMVAELRQKLSDSMARDNAMLQERGHLLETVDTLLQAINHASTEQRSAVDALVASSAELLDRVGHRFTEHIAGETGKIAAVADQVSGSAADVASLGEALGTAVRLFDESNSKLVAQLERIESALAKSLTRSDEQLAYYVAQAREVVDLSMLSQKQILQELRQINHDGTA
ncbi:DUF802 domain-containing protein [Bordetella avium]|uniref:DUF802 domain-containing protein n=1 Tax=Bordetella avium TaxID=521 RepID=UPI000E67A39E|nr:DUF802 domain-containing protein [Bordetella avium]RIQ42450.1 DUF802 domain-containing protein [Bordetella avium]RIQ48252.1 DUF802 domain-containing protein [Bordetella avium]RIQ52466.1 DUF802 domain-containing protein [Bordetella avium]RIQ57919.1 DUF802 domain-containing protein [Bordetella avium]RIQ72464.1 DUF802 domain-containing protein [Bordetella avium]